MAKLEVPAGTTSKLVQVFVLDSTSITGAGLTGLTSTSSGLTACYYREGAATSTTFALTSMTLGTWASGGFVVVDASAMPGFYQIGLPDAAVAASAKSVSVMLRGATNMVDLPLEIELIAFNNQSATVTAGSGTITTVTGGVTVTTNNDKTGYGIVSINSTVSTSINTAVWDETSGIETGLTQRGAMRLVVAAEAGKTSGASTISGTFTVRNAVADSKARITAAYDSSGNRTAVTTDTT